MASSKLYIMRATMTLLPTLTRLELPCLPTPAFNPRITLYRTAGFAVTIRMAIPAMSEGFDSVILETGQRISFSVTRMRRRWFSGSSGGGTSTTTHDGGYHLTQLRNRGIGLLALRIVRYVPHD